MTQPPINAHPDPSVVLAAAAIALSGAPPALREKASEIFVSLLVGWTLNGGYALTGVPRGAVALIESHIRTMLAAPQRASIAKLSGALLGLHGDNPALLTEMWGMMTAVERERFKTVVSRLEDRRLAQLTPRAWLTATRLTRLPLLPYANVKVARLAELFSQLDDQEICARLNAVHLPPYTAQSDEDVLNRARAQSASSLAGAFVELLIGLYVKANPPDLAFGAWERIARAVIDHPEWEGRSDALRWLTGVARNIVGEISERDVWGKFDKALKSHSLFVMFALYDAKNRADKYLFERLLGYASVNPLELLKTAPNPQHPLEPCDIPAVEYLARHSFLCRLDAQTFLTLTRRSTGDKYEEVYEPLVLSDLSDALQLPPERLTPVQRGILFAYAAADPQTTPAQGRALLERMLQGLSEAEIGKFARVIEFSILAAYNKAYMTKISHTPESCLTRFINSDRQRYYGVVRDLFNAHAREIGSVHRVVVKAIEERSVRRSDDVEMLTREIAEFGSDPFEIGGVKSYYRFVSTLRYAFGTGISNYKREQLFAKLPPRWGMLALLFAYRHGLDHRDLSKLEAIVAPRLDELDTEILRRALHTEQSPDQLLPLDKEIALRLRAIDLFQGDAEMPSLHSVHRFLPSASAEQVLDILDMFYGGVQPVESGDEAIRKIAMRVAEACEALKRGHLPVAYSVLPPIALRVSAPGKDNSPAV